MLPLLPSYPSTQANAEPLALRTFGNCRLVVNRSSSANILTIDPGSGHQVVHLQIGRSLRPVMVDWAEMLVRHDRRDVVEAERKEGVAVHADIPGTCVRIVRERAVTMAKKVPRAVVRPVPDAQRVVTQNDDLGNAVDWDRDAQQRMHLAEMSREVSLWIPGRRLRVVIAQDQNQAPADDSIAIDGGFAPRNAKSPR